MTNLALAKLQALSRSGNLPHAWLFVGSDHAMQHEVAVAFSAWLLCGSPNNSSACGVCKTCSMFAANTHPDYCLVQPAEDKTTILLDDVRELNNFLSTKAQFGVYRIVLIFPADKMNLAVANSLLKNLEEPGPNTLIILLSSSASILLKTIVSRCQILHFDSVKQPESQELENVKQMINYLLDIYLQRHLTEVELVDMLVKRWPNEVLYWFELALADIILCSYTHDPQYLRYPSLYDDLLALSDKIGVHKLWLMLTKVQTARYSFGSGQRPNLQLVLEDLVL